MRRFFTACIVFLFLITMTGASALAEDEFVGIWHGSVDGEDVVITYRDDGIVTIDGNDNAMEFSYTVEGNIAILTPTDPVLAKWLGQKQCVLEDDHTLVFDGVTFTKAAAIQDPSVNTPYGSSAEPANPDDLASWLPGTFWQHTGQVLSSLVSMDDFQTSMPSIYFLSEDQAILFQGETGKETSYQINGSAVNVRIGSETLDFVMRENSVLTCVLDADLFGSIDLPYERISVPMASRDLSDTDGFYSRYANGSGYGLLVMEDGSLKDAYLDEESLSFSDSGIKLTAPLTRLGDGNNVIFLLVTEDPQNRLYLLNSQTAMRREQSYEELMAGMGFTEPAALPESAILGNWQCAQTGQTLMFQPNGQVIIAEEPVTYEIHGDDVWLFADDGYTTVIRRATIHESSLYFDDNTYERVLISHGFEYRINDAGEAAIIHWTPEDGMQNVNLGIPPRLDGYPVVELDEDAFANCEVLRSVTTFEGLQRIGEKCFAGCQNLVSLELPGTLQEIGKNAFEGCMQLQELRLQEGFEKMVYTSFQNSGIQRIYVPRSVNYIDGFRTTGYQHARQTIEFYVYPDSYADNWCVQYDDDYEVYLHPHKYVN